MNTTKHSQTSIRSNVFFLSPKIQGAVTKFPAGRVMRDRKRWWKNDIIVA